MTFRAKIAALLVASIVAAVALITLGMVYAFRPSNEDVIDVFAGQLILMQQLASKSPDTGMLSPHPAPGELDVKLTELCRAATSRLGSELDIVVTSKASATHGRVRAVSVRVSSEGWIVTDLFVRNPSNFVLWGWFVLTTIAVGSVSLFAANRMSRPLALLERAVETVDQDSILPVLPEQGPAEVRATAIALNSLSARLQQAVASRMRLVAAAGHDLRTPLTRMRLRAEFVENDEKRAPWLKDIDELERIAESAIQLVREETTQPSQEIVEVARLVRSVVAELRDQKFAIEVVETREMRVLASHMALSRALRNLFINAATHGLGGNVTVDGGATARITIADRGPGIAPDLMCQVFEPFFRVDRARSQPIPGAGLGLTIAHEIVRKAGGSITISNRPGGGLLQIVELPLLRTTSRKLAVNQNSTVTS